jgi:5-methylcytosine-specific restriction endonuclease McrA
MEHYIKPMDFFTTDVTENELKRERAKAREIRKSQWWKRRLSEGRCYYCNGKFIPKELTMEHIVPLIRGGKSTKGNIVPACKECNNKKKHMLPIEWEEYLKKLKGEEN